VISLIKGTAAFISGADVTVMVSGVGYLVHVPAGVELGIKVGDEILFHTHLIAREDALDLYGFVDMRQKEIFSLLLSVSGVGPKTAMNILSGIEPDRFLEEVVGENIGYLSSLPGIGKKSAQRIVLELKERIAKKYSPKGTRRGADKSQDAVAALMALGYPESQARRAVGSVEAETVEDVIRSALKELMR